ncbi:Tat (twin-arginine translocation) pathway signal sequence containing protein [Mycobacterium kansasii]|nr:Tat (twin-arginine translocation) pathway signal sequence containing protein [Mycobacterium kansasii]POX97536.1 Tat (twin-arginine translocation) pathway signal sequence containing protein [Mycobacterium kansasii]POY15935.1 Tat (twin-arginine translocation) pathway signal sequence containing protein [Mycobacterium kansasii]
MPPGIPAAPGLPGGSFSPAAAGQGISPTSLGQSFATGMMTGQPAAAGAQSLSAGTMHAMESGATPAPQTASPLPTPPPVAAPTIAATGIESAAIHPSVDTSATAAGTPVMAAGDTGTAAVAPTVVTSAPMSAPVTPAVGPAVPAGPLPAYGSDLRPPAVTAGPTPSAVAAPVSGAPVAPSASSSPSAGGPLVSPVERTASGTTTGGQVGASGTTMSAASAASATSGAAAGAVSARAAEQQRLERLVDAVARQEPRLSWAAGLREDGTTTTLLVTDLAGGWIPPHIRLPANVTLLEPAARRRDVSVVDLLGAVVAAAAHEPNAYIGEPGPDAPLLSGDRAARSAAPKVDELGPTLVEAVRRRDGLPRIAQAIAAPAVRKTGVLESETRLLRERLTAIQESVLNAYPDHELSALGDWMLMAAIDALIDEHQYLANYHMAWFAVVARREGSGGFAA